MMRVLASENIGRKLSNVSLIEAKWKAISTYNKNKNTNFLNRANITMHSLNYNQYFEIIDSWKSTRILDLADKVLIAGHKDYMDCLLLATAKYHNLVFITEDREFEELIEKLDWEIKILNWKTFIRNYFE